MANEESAQAGFLTSTATHMASWLLALLSLCLLVRAGLGPFRMCGLEMNWVEGRWPGRRGQCGDSCGPAVLVERV